MSEWNRGRLKNKHQTDKASMDSRTCGHLQFRPCTTGGRVIVLLIADVGLLASHGCAAFHSGPPVSTPGSCSVLYSTVWMFTACVCATVWSDTA